MSGGPNVVRLGRRGLKRDPSACIDPFCTIIGDVTLHADVSVWPGAIIRADDESVTIGAGSAVLDKAFIEGTVSSPARIGKGCIIGHGAIIHGGTVQDGAFVGMGVIVSEGAVVGKESIVEAGSILPPNVAVPDRAVASGHPARRKRDVSEPEMASHRGSLESILRKARKYRRLYEGDPLAVSEKGRSSSPDRGTSTTPIDGDTARSGSQVTSLQPQVPGDSSDGAEKADTPSVTTGTQVESATPVAPADPVDRTGDQATPTSTPSPVTTPGTVGPSPEGFTTTPMENGPGTSGPAEKGRKTSRADRKAEKAARKASKDDGTGSSAADGGIPDLKGERRVYNIGEDKLDSKKKVNFKEEKFEL